MGIARIADGQPARARSAATAASGCSTAPAAARREGLRGDGAARRRRARQGSPRLDLPPLPRRQAPARGRGGRAGGVRDPRRDRTLAGRARAEGDARDVRRGLPPPCRRPPRADRLPGRRRRPGPPRGSRARRRRDRRLPELGSDRSPRHCETKASAARMPRPSPASSSRRSRAPWCAPAPPATTRRSTRPSAACSRRSTACLPPLDPQTARLVEELTHLWCGQLLNQAQRQCQ